MFSQTTEERSGIRRRTFVVAFLSCVLLMVADGMNPLHNRIIKK
ncbi:hypothetical protein X975_18978, partial [Stegodyphus mimosarum]